MKIKDIIQESASAQQAAIAIAMKKAGKKPKNKKMAESQLNELFDSMTDYYKLTNGQLIKVDYKQDSNADGQPGSIQISAVDSRLMPTQGQGTPPWDKARTNIRSAIQKWVAANTEAVAEGWLNEFAPGNGDEESGRWYSDDEMTELVGEGWWNDLDTNKNLSKSMIISDAQAWLDDQGYDVRVINVKFNDDGCDWYIEGNFHNPGFADREIDEGWKSKLAGAALAGAAALGGGGAHAADLSHYNTQYLQQVVSGEHPRPMISADDARIELQARANGKQQSVTPEPSSARSGYSKEWLQKAADPNRSGRYMISVERAQELLNQMNEGLGDVVKGIAKGVTRSLKGKPSKDELIRQHELKGWGNMADGNLQKSRQEFQRSDKIKKLEETYHGDEFYEAYGDLWYDEEQLNEAEYHGRKVQLGKPMRGDVKKFKVFVRDPKTGNVKKVNFGDPNMRIKKSNPARRKSFRARHHCENPGPRTSARYWSCRKW
jgi:hypothetical protein